MEDVWAILTDYNNLAYHVPNLIQSYLVPNPTNPSGIRLFQEGAQKIVGFDFRAALVMDMFEESNDENSSRRQKFVRFRLVESGMFSAFEGAWSLRTHSRIRKIDPNSGALSYTYNTLLTYSVLVRPKGLVPVLALEWRIREDVPPNLNAIKKAAEKLTQKRVRGADSATFVAREKKWESDETLGMYMAPKSSSITSDIMKSNKEIRSESIISKMFQNILPS